MKYHINTVLTGSFFLLVFVWLAIAHFNDREDGIQEDSAVTIETKPIELYSIMRLLMINIQTINEGIYTQNYGLIEKGAKDINDHPPLAPKSRQLVQETLGERMAYFWAYDKVVHARADSIRQAAIDRDMERVRNHYRIMEQGCVSCHASFQKEIERKRQTQEQTKSY